ncbi:TPA: high-affinity branched-chain amino acid ABC transporter ATP-binding protein LivG [bacterium]|nr:high-affinity branched-chain amino acid ABC transporter ATP-binding protein LivG [bacterium]
MLRIDHLYKSFGGISAVKDFNLHIKKGVIFSIIGPNGAGKTTLFNLITGLYSPDRGDIQLEGRDVTGLPPHLIAKMGISRTFQNIRLFENLTVLDNIRVGFHLKQNYRLSGVILNSKAYKKEEEEIKERTHYLLKGFKMEGYQDNLASSLPYGEQRKLEIIRALATNPKLLLLDEPGAGMNHKEQEEITNFIRWIRDEFELTILLIEHQMKVVMNISEKVIVMDFGETIAMGKPQEIQNNPRVIEAYLGGEECLK